MVETASLRLSRLAVTWVLVATTVLQEGTLA